MRFEQYLKKLRSQGQLAFTVDRAISDLDITPNALRCGIYKLKKKNEIISPAKGLYVIVPPEYAKLGSLPPNELLAILVRHWKLPYYVCLLTAAQYYGASHQAAQVFQVMVNKRLRPIEISGIKIEFIYKKNLQDFSLNKITTKTGELNLASPELLVFDLFHYRKHTGGLNNILNILSELIDENKLDIKKIVELARKYKDKSWLQRLGYLLDKSDSLDEDESKKLSNQLYKNIKQTMIDKVMLSPKLPSKNKIKNIKWNIIENDYVESDL